MAQPLARGPDRAVPQLAEQQLEHVWREGGKDIGAGDWEIKIMI